MLTSGHHGRGSGCNLSSRRHECRDDGLWVRCGCDRRRHGDGWCKRHRYNIGNRPRGDCRGRLRIGGRDGLGGRYRAGHDARTNPLNDGTALVKKVCISRGAGLERPFHRRWHQRPDGARAAHRDR